MLKAIFFLVRVPGSLLKYTGCRHSNTRKFASFETTRGIEMRPLTHLATIALGGFVAFAHDAKAATFNVVYDDSPTAAIDSPIVGTGILSFDGPATAGSFALNTLTNLSFSIDISGNVFDLADLNAATPLDQAGIFVTDNGGGDFSFVFTGAGTAPFSGSTDFDGPVNSLGHEPTAGIADGAGAFGGSGLVNLYQLFDSNTFDPVFFGDYCGTTSNSSTACPLVPIESGPVVVPIPGALGLLLSGLFGLFAFSRRTSLSMKLDTTS